MSNKYIRRKLINLKLKQRDLTSKKQKQDVRFLILLKDNFFPITGSISISAFVSLVGIPIGSAGSTTGLKFCGKSEVIKTCKRIIKKKARLSNYY